MHIRLLVPLMAVFLLAKVEGNCERVEFGRDFSALEGWVKAVEKPWRQEICLNGRWQFQPVSLPKGWKRGTGSPPELPLPSTNRWEGTPIKIPSAWNVNTWGAGRNVGEGTATNKDHDLLMDGPRP
jgi:beta-galactosidase